METPVETTLMGWKAWTVVGVISFSALIYVLGIYNNTARPYIEGAVKTMLSVIPVIK